jgi:hypothetical protein
MQPSPDWASPAMQEIQLIPVCTTNDRMSLGSCLAIRVTYSGVSMTQPALRDLSRVLYERIRNIHAVSNSCGIRVGLNLRLPPRSISLETPSALGVRCTPPPDLMQVDSNEGGVCVVDSIESPRLLRASSYQSLFLLQAGPNASRPMQRRRHSVSSVLSLQTKHERDPA